MKTSFNQPGDPRPESVNRICGSRSPFFALRRLAFTFPSAARGRRGVALVVTLVMLSVITFMAITFLVLSRRERGSVAITTDQSIARFTAESALQRATAELLAVITSQNNEHQFDLLVSTNYINYQGFQTTPPAAYRDPTNVSYVYPDGTTLNTDDLLQNLANLWYDPRPPVVMTNVFWGTNGAYDFRYYLDLNRNRRHDTNGYWPIFTSDPNNPFYDTNGVPQPASFSGPVLRRHFVGDPEWIGVPVFPDRPHSSSNQFQARYAYIVLPAGKTLDVNHIHNYAKRLSPTMEFANGDGFARNQGVGSWEINLGAFFTDLNTNFWQPNSPLDYRYVTNAVPPGTPNMSQGNTGVAFDDALAFLRYRYRSNNISSYQHLENAATVFGVNAPIIANDGIDQYSDGTFMTGTVFPVENDAINVPWSGADNQNYYFTMQEIFDPAKTSAAFTNRLLQAGTNVSSYDRYTYYRLLAQLGTDSSPQEKRMNINYRNVTNGTVVPNLQTNLLAWESAEDFFTNAASRMLRQLGQRDWNDRVVTVTNIPIYPATNNFYRPSIHRLLQLAANMYDATTNRNFGNVAVTNAYYPSVFRPLFRRSTNENVIFIAGYRELHNAALAESENAPVMVDLQETNAASPFHLTLIPPTGAPFDPVDKNEPMVWGIPLIIGAKKGLPNFNELAMETRVQVTRKLEFKRPGSSIDLPPATNQMYLLSISNLFGVEAWNSYSNSFPRSLRMITRADFFVVLTNQNNQIIFSKDCSFSSVSNLNPNIWNGFVNPVLAFQPSFLIPLVASTNIMTNAWNNVNQSPFFLSPSASFQPQNVVGFPTPQWWMNLRVRTRFILVDTSITPNRILDYVNVDEHGATLDITGKLLEGASCPQSPSANIGDQWCTNRLNNSPLVTTPTWGVLNQIAVGLSNVVVTSTDWANYSMDPSAGADRGKAIDKFQFNLNFAPTMYPGSPYFKSNVFHAPFNPTRTIYIHSSWQANDPLVHYTGGDLASTNRADFIPDVPPLPNLRQVNRRYEPWGGGPASASESPTKFELAVKDPMVTRSDDWDFPTNQFPNIGWLGRVHRGTPWQTIYMKSTDAGDTNQFETKIWQDHSGNRVLYTRDGTHYFRDSDLTLPRMDQGLFDLFTAEVHDNATRGRLSVNQTNLAAWSAVLSGVITLTNVTSSSDLLNFAQPQYSPFIIQPAGIYDPFGNVNDYPAVARIVHGINRTRTTLPKDVFTNAANVLSVPELTVSSPFLNTSTVQRERGIGDAVYERIPQQIMSLLTINDDPRFVIYSYGQTLHPAPNSLVIGGPHHGMCTNYQVTAETATRAVVRVENAGGNNPRIVIEQFNVLPPD